MEIGKITHEVTGEGIGSFGVMEGLLCFLGVLWGQGLLWGEGDLIRGKNGARNNVFGTRESMCGGGGQRSLRGRRISLGERILLFGGGGGGV